MSSASKSTLVNVSEFLTGEEIARLRRKSDVVGGFLVLHAWGLIAGAMALFALWPNPLTFVGAAVVVGGRQLGLAILMHDAAHGLLFRRRPVNEWVGQWLCAYPIITDMAAYRPYHLRHHRLTQQPDDPDLALSAPFPITRQSLRRKFLRDLTGRTAYQRRRLQVLDALGAAGRPWPERLGRARRKLGGAVATNLALFAILTGLGHWYLYPLLWLIPLATWYQLISRVRNIAEHAMVPDNDDPLRNTRTTLAGPLTRLALAPYRVNYHLEHHLFLFVPCWRLPEAHRLLLRKGYGTRMELQPDYRAVLRTAASGLTEGARASAAGSNGGQLI
jgi:fatty acid desaturase